MCIKYVYNILFMYKFMYTVVVGAIRMVAILFLYEKFSQNQSNVSLVFFGAYTVYSHGKSKRLLLTLQQIIM